MIVVDGNPHVGRPPPVPVEWRARVGDGRWVTFDPPLRYQFAIDARREAARRMGHLDPQDVEVERVK